MNISGLILLASGFLLGNPKARNDFFAGLQNLAGHGVDALNKLGGDANVAEPTESEESAE